MKALRVKGLTARKEYTTKYRLSTVLYTTDNKTTEIFTEIIVDLHTVAKNKTKILCTLCLASYNDSTFKITIQCHKQDTDNDKIYHAFKLPCKAFLTSQYTFVFYSINASKHSIKIVCSPMFFTSPNWSLLTI